MKHVLTPVHSSPETEYRIAVKQGPERPHSLIVEDSCPLGPFLLTSTKQGQQAFGQSNVHFFQHFSASVDTIKCLWLNGF